MSLKIKRQPNEMKYMKGITHRTTNFPLKIIFRCNVTTVLILLDTPVRESCYVRIVDVFTVTGRDSSYLVNCSAA